MVSPLNFSLTITLVDTPNVLLSFSPGFNRVIGGSGFSPNRFNGLCILEQPPQIKKPMKRLRNPTKRRRHPVETG
jgi:hypothetical protein